MPRTLAAAVRRDISLHARTRGEKYFDTGRVTLGLIEEDLLTAEVRGTHRYGVSLRLDDRRLVVDCTCPQFDRSLQACKHVWAAILAADSARLLTPRHDLYVDAERDEYDDVEDADALDERTLFDSDAQTQAQAEEWTGNWAGRRKGQPPRRPKAPPPPEPWETFLKHVRSPSPQTARMRAIQTDQLVYVFEAARSVTAGGVHIEVMARTRKKSGDWSKPKPVAMTRVEIAQMPEGYDRWLLDSLAGAMPMSPTWGYYGGMPLPSANVLNPTLQRALLPRLCATGRLFLRPPAPPDAAATNDALVPIDWDPDPVSFDLRVLGNAASGYTVSAGLAASDGQRPFTDLIFLNTRLVLWAPKELGARPRFAPFELGAGQQWLDALMQTGPVTIPATHAASLVEALALTGLTPPECPDELRVQAVTEPPRSILRLRRPPNRYSYHPSQDRLDVQLSFGYGGREIDPWSADDALVDAERRQAWRRDREAEAIALARLTSFGVRRIVDWQTNVPRLDVATRQMPALVRALTSEGWQVEAEGRLHRTAGTVTLDVRSGIDWFELHGNIDFDGVSATLPALLAALRRGDTFITLDDGSVGQVPETWLSRSGWIAELGTAEGDHLRFRRTQTALLDAWLAAQPTVSCDEAFSRARTQLASFDGIAAVEPPSTFHGVLRDYQRDALGWFAFLRQFGFGGCLADEMGLGKTVMVLAALDAHRLQKGEVASGPSLVVVPRSLIFNWQDEARRFAPELRVLDCSGSDRRERFTGIQDRDVVLITYGTLRRDIERLREIEFDYVILDEAQAVKNARTNAALAVRSLRARHRLALSGTPVENHLGELWSLFEFLNPGMLGAASVFAGGTARTVDPERLGVMARGLRPFILRRTKEQVASELPARTEQTLYCDLEPGQRALYDELRAHYRKTLLQRVERDGLARSKMHVLEALLRLRQAACHPGLIDPKRAEDASAKLDALVPRLQELAEDGRKVLVFSQFTSLLALLRPRLAQAALAYAYLDGRTKNRAERVRQFEADECPLFLISLKAGGLGLNLTAAEYVFLLDPWWNPAVEAQAIDRAHRIGQTKPVFAYRLIARDTVEEKVLELQATKRKLAEAIVRADESLVRDLRREDLELLLS